VRQINKKERRKRPDKEKERKGAENRQEKKHREKGKKIKGGTRQSARWDEGSLRRRS